MFALSVRQPWAKCISHGRKRIENRSWSPPSHLVGKPLAIHASQTYDDDPATEHFVWNVAGSPFWEPAEMPRGAVVAVARLTAVVTSSTDIWFTGPFGWVLDGVVALPEAVICAGQQGVWSLPTAVVPLVRAQYQQAHREKARRANRYITTKHWDG